MRTSLTQSSPEGRSETQPKKLSKNTGEMVSPVEGEPFRFRVQSDQTEEQYLVDIQETGFSGACNCMHFLARLAPKIAHGERGPTVRCKHIRRAREHFLEYVLPRLAKELGMEEPDIYEGSHPTTEYQRIRLQFLAKHTKCAVFPALKSSEIHHAFGRLGNLLTETRLWIPVSRAGHVFVDANRNKARTMTWNGVPLLAPLGEWNNPKKERLT